MSSVMVKRWSLRGLVTDLSGVAPHLSSSSVMASAPAALGEAVPSGAAMGAVAKQILTGWQSHADMALLHLRAYSSAAGSLHVSQLGENTPMTTTFACSSLSGHGVGPAHLGWNLPSRQLRGLHKAGDPMIGVEPEKKKHSEEENRVLAEKRGATTQSYWSIPTRTYTREDGTEWPWHSFKPSEAYKADLSIDMHKHHKPENFSDSVALTVVKLLRIPTDLLFQRRYGCRAMMLETVAAVPGMVGGMLLHLESLRRFEHTGGWIRTLLDEAENERMHLMTFMEVSQPKWWERMLVLTVQGVFFNAYFLIYLIAPRVAHRVVGYLEEEAVHSYTEFLKEIDNGNIENVPAPQLAIDYWSLPKDATLRDVVMVVRADEAHHRDVNHFASDVLKQGKTLRQVGAPKEYH